MSLGGSHRRPTAAVFGLLLMVLLASACAPGADLYSPASSSTDGRLIRIHVAACHAELTAHVEERPDRVMVRVGARHGYDGDCGGRIDIHLSDPLGERALIDASDGDEIEVRVDDSLDELADPVPAMNGAAFVAELESRGFTIEQTEGPVEFSPFTMTRYPLSHTVTNLRIDSRQLVTYEFPDGHTAERRRSRGVPGRLRGGGGSVRVDRHSTLLALRTGDRAVSR